MRMSQLQQILTNDNDNNIKDFPVLNVQVVLT